jgi:hypothetical protein
VNDAPREGLSRFDDPRTEFSSRTVSHGRSRIGALDDIAAVLMLAEGERAR